MVLDIVKDYSAGTLACADNLCALKWLDFSSYVLFMCVNTDPGVVIITASLFALCFGALF